MRILVLKSVFLIIFLVGNFSINAQDWANLKRYQKENDTLLLKGNAENRVVFMGNSITEGWKSMHPEFFNKNPYICRGISGQTTPQMLLRFRQDVIELNPRVVVILAGTNDIAGNTGPSTPEMIMDNIRSMAELATANNIRVVLCSVLPAYDYPWRKGMKPNIKIPELNKMIKAYADERRITYLDYFGAMANEKNGMIAEYTTDGVHCTSAGYDVMEKMVIPAIAKALKTKPAKK
ncbi:MAG TPA: SGNH/GDSL hydrolase family protein [Paludibacteraceae bacterium]|nr:SGNH/GDSL hydrolase family protein [Paludibacteraceae bacterium]HPT43799.1 SGNH/GDSL hydrolase family protein [Paludibacteraceae bacterium]